MFNNDDLQKIGQLISASERRIIGEFNSFMMRDVIPQLDDKAETSVTDRLDNRIDRLSDKVNDHGSRLEKLERLTSPTTSSGT